MSVNVYSDFPDRVEAVIDIIDELGGKQDYLYRNFEHTIEDEIWDIAKEYDAKFLKDLIALKTPNFKVKSDDNQQCIFSLEKKNTDEYSLKIISDIKSLARTTYGGEEQNFDFIIYKDKVLALNVTTENGGIKTFSENGIADTEEQVKSTKELLNTLEDLNNKYHIRESIENKVKKFDNKKVKKQN